MTESYGRQEKEQITELVTCRCINSGEKYNNVNSGMGLGNINGRRGKDLINVKDSQFKRLQQVHW